MFSHFNKKTRAALFIAVSLLVHSAAYSQSVPVQKAPLLVAAGSLRGAMNDMIVAYREQGGATFAAQYGPSGKLRKQIESGKQVDVFASADARHTQALEKQTLLNASRDFTHNSLCVIAQPTIGLTEKNLVKKLTQPSVRVATSTPVSDPMGDYTWQFFRKADQTQVGAYQILNNKALKLSGASAPKPGEKLPYVTAFEDSKADAYVMYCTNAVTTNKALPQLQIVQIPEALNVRSTYGIAAHPASVEGDKFIRFVLSPKGQNILRKYGFN